MRIPRADDDRKRSLATVKLHAIFGVSISFNESKKATCFFYCLAFFAETTHFSFFFQVLCKFLFFNPPTFTQCFCFEFTTFRHVSCVKRLGMRSSTGKYRNWIRFERGTKLMRMCVFSFSFHFYCCLIFHNFYFSCM